MGEIYVSTDVETDGPVPGVYSMLSLGSAAFTADKTLVAVFTVNLETLPGSDLEPGDDGVVEVAAGGVEAARKDLRPPAEAMGDYLAWLKALPGKPVFVGYPAAFDFMFVCWYLNRFTGENPFGWFALDIKTFAMSLLGLDFLDTVKRNMPRRWFDDLPYTHKALDDAISQGALFCNMLAEHQKTVNREP